MLVELIRFLKVSVMPQNTTHAHKGDTGFQKPSPQRFTFLIQSQRPRGSRALALGAHGAERALGRTWVSVSAKGFPHVAPRPYCSENKVLPV